MAEERMPAMELDRTANIFNIQHFSVHDGPGVRTVIFFKGCNLRCLWCHNPESISGEREIMFYPEKCIGCGACVAGCPAGAHSLGSAGASAQGEPSGEKEDSFVPGALPTEAGSASCVEHRIDREKCRRCMACCEECYADALVSVGQRRTVEEIFREIGQSTDYFRQSGGGVTFSGGECMLQMDALEQLLALCKRAGIHRAVDTAGNVPWSSFQRILGLTDLFLYDIKAIDPVSHKRCTGVENGRILDNFRRLVESGAKVIVRVPWVPEQNGDEIPAIAAFLSQFPQVRAELLPFHSMGNSKRSALGAEGAPPMTAPDKRMVAQVKEKYHFD